MDISNLNFIKYKNNYLLVDDFLTNPIMLSQRAYDILSAYKEGKSLMELKTIFGDEIVKSIFKGIQKLEHEKKINVQKRDTYSEAENAISEYLKSDIVLLEGMLMVSQTCNMKCRYCFGGESGTFNERGLMDKKTAEMWFRYFLSQGGNQSFQKFIFFGGEPLLNFPVIKYIVELWSDIKHRYNGREIFFALTTNGTLLTTEIVEFLKDKNINITISLDGPKNIHDANRRMVDGSPTFDKVMKGIDFLRKYEIPISVRSTATKQGNIDSLYDFFADQNFDIHTIGIVDYPMEKPQTDYQLDFQTYNKFVEKGQHTVMKGCFDVLAGKKDSFVAKQMSMAYQKSFEKRKEYPFLCGGGCWFVTFGIDGYIYPCNRVVGNEYFRIGDIENGLNKDKMAKILCQYLKSTKDCNSCWAEPLCKRRCFHQRMCKNGFTQIPEELCDIYRNSFAESLVFAHEMQNYVAQGKQKIKEAVNRFEPEHMMHEICHLGGEQYGKLS